MHNKSPLVERLIEYSQTSVTPFDVPGHKMGRYKNKFYNYLGEHVVKMDVNSMPELDLLCSPDGVIKEAQDLMADAYGADYAYFLVNGSSVGCTAMLLAALKPHEEVLVPRNIHRSVISGLCLCGAKPIYVMPEIDHNYNIANAVSFKEYKDAIDNNPNVKAIFLINPTYFGVIGEIEKIISYAKSKDLIVLVDQAHGAHFPFYEQTKEFNAVTLGADLIVVSTHKTLGSLTQSSVLLHNSGKISNSIINRTLNMLQTTSANYLLMASLDGVRHDIMTRPKEFFENSVNITNYAKKKITEMGGYVVLGDDIINENNIALDPLKIAIKVNEIGLNGFEVYNLLKKECNIQLELAEIHTVLAIVSVGDTLDTIEQLIKGLKHIKDKYQKERFQLDISLFENIVTGCTPKEAFFGHHTAVNIDDAIGKISANSIMIYPPGIPLVVPGEIITKELIELYKFYVEQGNFTLSDNGSRLIDILEER